MRKSNYSFHRKKIKYVANKGFPGCFIEMEEEIVCTNFNSNLKWGKMALKSSLVELIYPEHIHQLLVPQSRLPCVTSTKTIDIEIHKLEKLPAAKASS